jgi:hypothetical protein
VSIVDPHGRDWAATHSPEASARIKLEIIIHLSTIRSPIQLLTGVEMS